jgi:N-6 DNA methylase
MAFRPVFVADLVKPYVTERSVEFEYHSGFSVQQKQRSVASLHRSFGVQFPDLHILEVSSKGNVELGVRLSAFNLMIQHGNRGAYSVESAFQSSKVFACGGPFVDLLEVSGREAKKDERLTKSGNLVGFRFFSREFPLNPLTYFYDWLYASALWRNRILLEQVLSYDAFTDIEYNPKRSINCQARSVAKVVGLARAGLLAEALRSPMAFLELGYTVPVDRSSGIDGCFEAPEQRNLF